MYDLDAKQDLLYSLHIHEISVEGLSKTPPLFLDKQFIRDLRKNFFGEQGTRTAKELSEKIILAKNLFFEIKVRLKQEAILENKNLITKSFFRHIKNKQQSSIQEIVSLYESLVRALTDLFYKLINESKSYLEQSIVLLKKELSFVTFTSSPELIRNLRALLVFKEKNPKLYSFVSQMCDGYYRNIPFSTFIAVLFKLTDSYVRKIFTANMLALRSILQEVNSDYVPFEELLQPSLHQFLKSFIRLFYPRINNFTSASPIELSHGLFVILSKFVSKKRYLSPNTMLALRSYIDNNIYFDKDESNYLGSFPLSYIISNPSLPNLLSRCAIRRIHNPKEIELLALIGHSLDKLSYEISDIGNVYKNITEPLSRNIISLSFFIQLLKVTPLSSFTKPLTFGQLRDMLLLDGTGPVLSSRKKVLFILSGSDHNGTFADMYDLLEQFPAEQFSIELSYYGERGNIFYERLRAFSSKLLNRTSRPLQKFRQIIKLSGSKQRIDYLFIAAHGSTSIIDLFNLNLDSHLVTSELFLSIKEFLSEDCLVVLASCSTGNQKNGVVPIAQHIATALQRRVIAPSKDCNIKRVILSSSGNIQDVVYSMGAESVHFYP